MLAATACSGGRSPSGGSTSTRDGGLTADAGAVTLPPGQCLAATCADSLRDCGSGERCNLALTPPRCQRLFCGPEGSACSEDVQCSEMHRCAENRCRGCTMCNQACAVLDLDPWHCGACNQPVPQGLVCRDGAPACPDSADTLCGAECANLRTSYEHCGACDRACGPFEYCDRGDPVRWLELTDRQSCRAACAVDALSCRTGAQAPADLAPFQGRSLPLAIYAAQGTAQHALTLGCEEAPAAEHQAVPFLSLLCACE